MWSRKVVTLFLIFRTLSLPDLSESQCKVWLFSHNSASCPHHRLDLWDIRTPWRREGTLEKGGKGRKGKRLVPIYTWTNIDNSNIHKLIWIRTLNSKTCLSFQCQEISACLWERLEAEDRITRSVCVCLLRADIRNRGRADSQGTPLWFNLFKRQKGSYSGATFVHLCVYMKEGLSACKPPHMRTHTNTHSVKHTVRWTALMRAQQHRGSSVCPDPEVHFSVSPQTYSIQPHIWIHETALKHTCRPSFLYAVWENGWGEMHVSRFFIFFLFGIPSDFRGLLETSVAFLPLLFLCWKHEIWHIWCCNDITGSSGNSEFVRHRRTYTNQATLRK